MIEYLNYICKIYRDELLNTIIGYKNNTNKIKVIEVNINNINFYIDYNNNVYIIDNNIIKKVGYLKNCVIYIND